MEIKLYKKEGTVMEEIKLPDSISELKVHPSVLYEAVRAYRLNQRSGTASTKTRNEVSGGSKKPWKQKHTGNARAGSLRSPLWRKGGIIFGPKPRDWETKLPKSKKRLALISALVSKVKSGEVALIEDFDLESHKTKSFVQILKKLNLDSKKLLFGDSKIKKNIKISSANVPLVDYRLAKDFNVYDVLRSQSVLITKSGYDELLKTMEKSK